MWICRNSGSTAFTRFNDTKKLTSYKNLKTKKTRIGGKLTKQNRTDGRKMFGRTEKNGRSVGIFSDGRTDGKISDGRTENFRSDGRKMLGQSDGKAKKNHGRNGRLNCI